MSNQYDDEKNLISKFQNPLRDELMNTVEHLVAKEPLKERELQNTTLNK